MKYALMLQAEDHLVKNGDFEHRWVYLVDGEWGYTLYAVDKPPKDVMVFDTVGGVTDWLDAHEDWAGHPWYFKVGVHTKLHLVRVKERMVQDGWEEVE